MTQPVTEKKRPPLKWIVPIPTNEGGSFGRPSLCAACRGNDVMAVILNYFVYEASTEAEQKKIDTLKVQSIQLKRTHDEILKGIHPSRISKKTLIDHMHKLETWGFLKVDGYHHIYEVFFPAITEAMKTPPPAEKRKPRGRHVSQKVKSTNLQSSEVKSTNHAVKTTNSEDCTLEQISNLQSEMLNLQSEMSKLQFEMLNLTFAQSSQAASQQVLTPLSEAPRLIDCNRLIETSNYVAANAGNDTPSFPFPVLESSLEAVTDETFKVAVMDDWREYKHLPRFTPTIDVMSEVLKRLQRESMYRSQLSTQQANDVDNTNDPHTGQLADSSTASQSRDNGVREVSDPLSTSERVNTSPLTPEPPAQLSPTSQNEVVQASNGQSPIAALATRNPDEEQATLSRSGENVPVGDGDTPTESGASSQGNEQPPLPRRGNGRKKKQAVDLDHVEVVPPPVKPDESAPWNARKVLAWGDYFRGYALPFSNNGNSHYAQNENAAVSIIQRGITEKNYVSVFRFMLGKKIMPDGTLANDPTFRDEWWPEKKSADVRYVEKHYTDMGVKINGRGKNGIAKGVSVQQQLQDKVPDFEVKSQADLIMMMPDERKAYAKRLNEHLTAQREREQSQQQQVSA